MNADQIHNPSSIRILLADDHTIMRQGLSLLLGRQEELTIIAEANNGQEAVDLFHKHRPDILLTDIEMPLMDGVTALAAIRTEYPDARVLLLTMHAREGDILRGMRAGAMGYVLKDAPLDTLLEAIHAVSAGRHWVAPEAGRRRPDPGGADRAQARLRLPGLTLGEPWVPYWFLNHSKRGATRTPP